MAARCAHPLARSPSSAAERAASLTAGSGIPPPIFLEGPTTDTQGNLFVVDVAYGRILKCDLNDSVGEAKDGEDGARRKDAGWSVLAEYDGEPNGLALDLDGTLIVADYKNGIVSTAVRSSIHIDSQRR